MSQEILIIDDDAEILDGLQTLLSEKYEVTTLDRAQAGLDRLAKEKFDAILLDCLMPEMDGPEFLRRFATTGSETPVIVMTASSHHMVGLNGLKFASLIRKPFGIEAVEMVIEHALHSPSGSVNRLAPSLWQDEGRSFADSPVQR
jgi:two-component system response regulator MprA